MNRPCRALCLALLLLLARAAGNSLRADDEPKYPTPPIAATVNGEPIFVGEVESNLNELIKTRRITHDFHEEARANVLRDVVTKRLIMQKLQKEGGYLDEKEATKQLKHIESQLKERKMTIEDFAARSKVTPDTARGEINWQLMWPKYLERHLADELEGYFKEHHKDLDGTEMRVSHILLRPDGAKETQEQVMKRAEKIRDEIESKKLTFDQAVEKYSIGPSRTRNGDLGFIPRNGVMTEQFSQASFALDKGDVSKPVNTNFGTHLILATDVKPGTKQWTEVIPQIQKLAARQLFNKMYSDLSKEAKIEYTGNSPYWDPDSGKLVVSKKTAGK